MFCNNSSCSVITPVLNRKLRNYVAHLAKHFEIPFRHDEEEEILLPLTFLDYRSMVAHEFIVDNDDKMLLYNLGFNKKHNEIITLSTPSLFDLTAG